MKQISIPGACFLVLFFSVSFANAQDLTGVWQGHFRSGNMATRSSIFDDRYKFEVQIAQHDKSLEAVTYSYLSSLFYGKAAAAGTINHKTNKVLIQEIKLLEVRNQSGDVCIMTCFLQYSKLGDEEYLEGNFVSMNVRDSSNCGRGTVFLRKVSASDFYKEPFLEKQEEVLKEKETPKKLPADPKKPETPALAGALKKNNPAKADPTAAPPHPPVTKPGSGNVPAPGITGNKTAPPAKKTVPATIPPAKEPVTARTGPPSNKETSPIKKPGAGARPPATAAVPSGGVAALKPASPAKKPASIPPPGPKTAAAPRSAEKTAPMARLSTPQATQPMARMDSAGGIGKKFPVVTPRILLSRSNQLVRAITVHTNEVVLNIYDDGAIDHDTISVYLDKKMVINHVMLTDRPIVLNLHLDDSEDFHELVMVADNEGEIPPNTSLMIVKAGDKEYEVRITSTEHKNAVVTFKYEKLK